MSEYPTYSFSKTYNGHILSTLAQILKEEGWNITTAVLITRKEVSMEISSEQNKPESVLPRWALALMSLLVLIVLIETAAVIYFSSRKPQNPVTEKPVKVTRYQPYSQAVSTSHPASYPVTYALSNRQHQPHWAQNNAAQHRTSGYDPFWTDAFTSF